MGASSSILLPTIAGQSIARFVAALENLDLSPELKVLLDPTISAIKENSNTAIFNDDKRFLLLLKVYVDHLKLAELPAIDDDEMMPVELPSSDLLQVAITSLKSTQGKVRDYSIIAENAEIEDLSSLLNLLGTACPPPLLLRDLNVTGNNIATLAPDTFALHSCINNIHLGGNPFQNFSPLAAIFPTTLVALDLSFTEGLVLERCCFVLCPQLIRLCLDGCELNSTMHDEIQGDNQQPSTRSIFYGLVQLNLLSLKENNLENPASLDGLQFFAFTDLDEDTSRFVPQSLEYLHIEDNPVSESQSALRATRSALVATIQSLKYINNETTTKKAVSSFDAIGSATRRKRDVLDVSSGVGNSLFSGGNENGLDAMEKEYLSALKGERDVSVVA